MLSRQQHNKSSKNNDFCHCVLLRSPAFHYQEGNIIISHPTQVSSSHISHPNAPLLSQRGQNNKPKTSLRGSRILKGKQNTTGQVTPEESHLHSNLNSQLQKTIANLAWASTPFDQTINLNENYRKTSTFVKRIVPQIEKTVDFRRYANKEQNHENQQTKKDLLFNQHDKLEPSIEQDCTNRTIDFSKDCKITESLQRSCQDNFNQTNFHSQKNISSQEITQYFSHQDLQPQKQNLMQEYSQQASTLILKRKTTKVLHYIQRLQFKSTQSINQTESAQVSQVISDIGSISSNQNQSQQNPPRPKRLSQLLKPKYSRIALNSQISRLEQL